MIDDIFKVRENHRISLNRIIFIFFLFVFYSPGTLTNIPDLKDKIQSFSSLFLAEAISSYENDMNGSIYKTPNTTCRNKIKDKNLTQLLSKDRIIILKCTELYKYFKDKTVVNVNQFTQELKESEKQFINSHSDLIQSIEETVQDYFVSTFIFAFMHYPYATGEIGSPYKLGDEAYKVDYTFIIKESDSGKTTQVKFKFYILEHNNDFIIYDIYFIDLKKRQALGAIQSVINKALKIDISSSLLDMNEEVSSIAHKYLNEIYENNKEQYQEIVVEK